MDSIVWGYLRLVLSLLKRVQRVSSPRFFRSNLDRRVRRFLRERKTCSMGYSLWETVRGYFLHSLELKTSERWATSAVDLSSKKLGGGEEVMVVTHLRCPDPPVQVGQKE